MRRTRNVHLISTTLTVKRMRRGTAAVFAAATLVVGISSPASAFAREGGKVTGFGNTDFDDTAATRLTNCQNTFSGHVTEDNAQEVRIGIDDISFSPCDPEAGISVTAGRLPWTMKIDSRGTLTVDGVDLNFVKNQGICRYTGTLNGGESFDGVYTISGALTRQSTGCHGPDRLGISILAESISVDGAPLTP